jgi:hypothetical protein
MEGGIGAVAEQQRSTSLGGDICVPILPGLPACVTVAT